MKQIIKNIIWLVFRSGCNPVKILKDSFYRSILNNVNFDLYVEGGLI